MKMHRETWRTKKNAAAAPKKLFGSLIDAGYQ
jgi:hypothetical protein